MGAGLPDARVSGSGGAWTESVPVSGVVARPSQTPGCVVRRAPRAGEHNRDIYGGLLGYPEERIADLESQGLI